MIEAIKSAIEAKFQALVADGRSFIEKAEEFVSLGSAAKDMAAIEATLTGIVSDGGTTDEQKVEAILRAVGKL